MKKRLHSMSLILLGGALIGCGGSGSDSPQPVVPNVQASVDQNLPPIATSASQVPFVATITYGSSSISGLSATENSETVTISSVSIPNVDGVNVIYDESAQIGGVDNCYMGNDEFRSLSFGQSCTFSIRFDNTSGESRTVSGNVVVHLSGANIPSLLYPIEIMFFAGDWTVLQSGQKICYTTNGTIDCANATIPRQDGAVQAGVPWQFEGRYHDNEDGTVTDLMTGLRWEQSPVSTTMNWSDALNRCNNLGTANEDWRLPNIRELLSVVSYGGSPGSALNNNTPISNISGRYWSSSTYVLDSERAWGIDFSNGNIIYSALGNKASGNGKVWCVSGETRTDVLAPVYQTGQEKCYGDNGLEISCNGTGQDAEYREGISWDLVTRYDDNGDGTVSDTLSGLMWQKDPSANGVDIDWSTALTICANLDLAGYDDWRAPNVLEWMSLVDFDVANQAENLNDNTPFENLAGSGIDQKFDYWTSTSYNGSYAWTLAIWDGDIALPGPSQNQTKSSTTNTYVMCVRGGVNTPS